MAKPCFDFCANPIGTEMTQEPPGDNVSFANLSATQTLAGWLFHCREIERRMKKEIEINGAVAEVV